MKVNQVGPVSMQIRRGRLKDLMKEEFDEGFEVAFMLFTKVNDAGQIVRPTDGTSNYLDVDSHLFENPEVLPIPFIHSLLKLHLEEHPVEEPE